MIASFVTQTYVTESGSGLQNGTSWANAFSAAQLQSAINLGVPQVWVAAGTYKPTTGSDRSISFAMKNGVTIYGGFNGTETFLGQRNWNTNITILSGDIGTNLVSTDNSYHVVSNLNLNNTAILDGFTIQGGCDNPASGNGLGAGILNLSSSPVIINCKIINNTVISIDAAASGAALYNSVAILLLAIALSKTTLSKHWICIRDADVPGMA